MKLTDQREIIITDLSEQDSVKIPNESLVCSCRFKDNILIFSESGDNYNYYDIARNTAIDVGNFVCWLPDSLSFFENQTVLNVNIIILKRFSKESSDSLEDRCIAFRLAGYVFI